MSELGPQPLRRIDSVQDVRTADEAIAAEACWTGLWLPHVARRLEVPVEAVEAIHRALVLDEPRIDVPGTCRVVTREA
jgi:hypothetical protein